MAEALSCKAYIRIYELLSRFFHRINILKYFETFYNVLILKVRPIKKSRNSSCAWCFSFPKCKSCHYSTRFSPTSLQQKTVTKNYFFKSLKFLLWPNTIDKGAESEPLKLKYNIFLPFKKNVQSTTKVSVWCLHGFLMHKQNVS